MKRKIFKLILILSFVPFTCLLIRSIYSAIFGYDVYSWFISQYIETVYGVKAFANSFFEYSIVLIFSYPIIPVCLTYQIIYIIIYIIKRIINKNKRKEK